MLLPHSLIYIYIYILVLHAVSQALRCELSRINSGKANENRHGYLMTQEQKSCLQKYTASNEALAINIYGHNPINDLGER